MKKQQYKFILFIALIGLFTLSSNSIYSTAQTSLDDDSSLYHQIVDYDPNYYSFNVTPGKYAVVSFRSGDASLDGYLFGDLGYTIQLGETYIHYFTEIDWREVGFFTIDGTDLSEVTTYYARAGQESPTLGNYYWIELENGESSGVQSINVGEQLGGSFSLGEVIDSYQVYLHSNKTYSIELDVPSDKTFDLYLCKGISDEDSSLGESRSNSLGADESIVRSVPADGYYCIVVTNPDYTTGSYNIKINELGDDNPKYSTTYDSNGGLTTYAAIARANKYCIIGVRGGPSWGPTIILYEDLGHTIELLSTSAQYRDSEIMWDEVAFLTFDATNLIQDKALFVQFTTSSVNYVYHWIEIENGDGTGLQEISPGDTVNGGFTSNEVFDSYLISLESTKSYNISLTVPVDKTFDLFIGHGIFSETSADASSHSDSPGANEEISSFNPAYTGDYVIIVSNPDYSSGNYVLEISTEVEDGDGNGAGIPGYNISILISFAFVFCMFSIGLIRKKLKLVNFIND